MAPENTASIVATVTTTAMKPATTQVARLCITSQTRESHIIVGIGMALGLPPEQPSDDGAEELACERRRIGPARERPIDGANDEVVTRSE